MPAPDLSKIPAFYHDYIRQVKEDSLQAALDSHLRPLIARLRDVSEDRWNYAYAPGKWTLKELVQHVIDSERIFAYRALCFARRDETPLPGFDENSYAANSAANERSGASILEELDALDRSTRYLFSSFNQDQLAATGTANGAAVSVEGLGYVLTGHALHHARIIGERYLGARLGGG